MEARSGGWGGLFLRIGFGVFGVAAMVLLVRSVGAAAFLGVAARAAPWLPLLFALEALRIAVEAASLWRLSRRVREVPLATLLRVHLVAYAVSVVAPAGRVAAEGTKAAMLASRIGGAHAAALAATQQSLSLFAAALTAATGAVAAFLLLGASPVSWGCFVSALVTASAYAVIQIAGRAKHLGGIIGRRFESIRAKTASFQSALALLPVLDVPAASVWVGTRALQALQLGILVHAVGGVSGLGPALLAEGVHVAGGAAGDFIPGQLGATDGAFTLAAEALRITTADALAIAVLVHFIQLVATVAGATAPLWWRDRAPLRQTSAAR